MINQLEPGTIPPFAAVRLCALALNSNEPIELEHSCYVTCVASITPHRASGSYRTPLIGIPSPLITVGVMNISRFFLDLMMVVL